MIYPANPFCSSEGAGFEVTRATTLTNHVITFFGEATFETPGQTFIDPAGAILCVSGDAVRPTFDWSEEALAQIDAVPRSLQVRDSFRSEPAARLLSTRPRRPFHRADALINYLSMVQAASAEPRYTSASYFALVEQGVLRADDRVELLEGVIVTMSPQNPRHASATTRVAGALRDALDKRALIRVQLPLVVGTYSVPEPDVAVVSGHAADYDDAHPTTALLVVEVADSSVAEDRLTKAGIYAAANIPEFWIVNLRDDCVEVFRTPDAAGRRYVETNVVHRGAHIEMVASEAAAIAVADLLPGSEQRP